MSVLGIVFGGLITIATAIFIEYLRRPKLKMTIELRPLDRTDAKGNLVSRHLRLMLHNQVPPLFAPWMQRASAIRCRGEITFHHLNDGQPVYERSMVVRWVHSPEPLTRISEGQVETTFSNQVPGEVFYTFTLDSRIDVYPGEEELFDVAVRFANERECYGWNNKSYIHNWRTPDWRLDAGRYLVRVVITSGDQKCEGLFRLVNDVDSVRDFRLTEALPGDRAQPVGSPAA